MPEISDQSSLEDVAAIVSNALENAGSFLIIAD